MSTMNISLPEILKSFVDRQVSEGGYGSTSEYIRDLIRKDLDRETLRGLLMEGYESELGRVADDAYFDSLRNQISVPKK